MSKLQYGWNPKNVQKGWWEKSSRRRGPSLQTVVKRAVAAERRSQRQALQRHRQLLKQQAEIAKMQERERATYEVSVFENLLEMLVSVHQECADICDWQALAQEPHPPIPSRLNTHEKAAQDAENNYRPGFLDRLLRVEERRRNALQQRVQLARDLDEELYQESIQKYQQSQLEWKQQVGQANRVLSGDWQAYLDVIHEAQPFNDVEELGSRIEISRGRKGEVVVTLHVNNSQVIPSEVKSLLKSGKLSIKQMSQSRFNSLYQDYVCGCVFRVARELFALLPIENVIVHCYGTVLNSSTGHEINECLLSVAMPRTEIEYLNFAALDPSDALQTLVHNMKFRKTQGFAPIIPLTPNDY